VFSTIIMSPVLVDVPVHAERLPFSNPSRKTGLVFKLIITSELDKAKMSTIAMHSAENKAFSLFTILTGHLFIITTVARASTLLST
jgi:hypothetical protein